MPRISTAIQRISQQIRLSLTLAKSSADLRVFISKSRPASERVLIKINSNSKTKAFEVHKFSSGLPQKAGASESRHTHSNIASSSRNALKSSSDVLSRRNRLIVETSRSDIVHFAIDGEP